MSNNVSVNSSVLGVLVCRLLLFRESVRIVVLFINKIIKKNVCNFLITRGYLHERVAVTQASSRLNYN